MSGGEAAAVRCYSAESCHEVGYAWTLTAPARLSVEAVESLPRALAQWSDAPSSEDIQALLADEDFCRDVDLSNPRAMRDVTVEVTIVHGERWAQSFHEVPIDGY